MKRKTGFLASKIWKKLRQETLERDGRKCVICEAKDKLCVHHILYRRNHSEFQAEPNNLITVCKRCHWAIHKLDGNLALVKAMAEKRAK